MTVTTKLLKAPFKNSEQSRIYSETNNASQEGINQVFKFQNKNGKWKFRWVKVTSFTKEIFDSEYAYDQILEVKNNCIYFLKNNQKGFWFFNTQTEFSFIST